MVKIKYPLGDLLKTRHANEPMINIFFDRIDNITTWFFANFTKITPNQVSTIGLILGIISAYMFFKGVLFFGALFYIVRHITDGVDGRLSRLTGQSSTFGAWYENYTGIITLFLCSAGLFVGQYLETSRIIWLILWPLVLQSFRLHNWASMKVAILLGDKFGKKVVQPNGKGLVSRIKTKLSKIGITDPFNSADGIILIFIISPLIGPVFRITEYIIIFWLIITACKEIFWFFYYKNILKKENCKK